MFLVEDNTDVEKGGAASHYVQPQAAPVMLYLTPPHPPDTRQPAKRAVVAIQGEEIIPSL